MHDGFFNEDQVLLNIAFIAMVTTSYHIFIEFYFEKGGQTIALIVFWIVVNYFMIKSIYHFLQVEEKYRIRAEMIHIIQIAIIGFVVYSSLAVMNSRIFGEKWSIQVIIYCIWMVTAAIIPQKVMYEYALIQMEIENSAKKKSPDGPGMEYEKLTDFLTVKSNYAEFSEHLRNKKCGENLYIYTLTVLYRMTTYPYNPNLPNDEKTKPNIYTRETPMVDLLYLLETAEDSNLIIVESKCQMFVKFIKKLLTDIVYHCCCWPCCLEQKEIAAAAAAIAIVDDDVNDGKIDTNDDDSKHGVFRAPQPTYETDSVLTVLRTKSPKTPNFKNLRVTQVGSITKPRRSNEDKSPVPSWNMDHKKRRFIGRGWNHGVRTPETQFGEFLDEDEEEKKCRGFGDDNEDEDDAKMNDILNGESPTFLSSHDMSSPSSYDSYGTYGSMSSDDIQLIQPQRPVMDNVTNSQPRIPTAGRFGVPPPQRLPEPKKRVRILEPESEPESEPEYASESESEPEPRRRHSLLREEDYDDSPNYKPRGSEYLRVGSSSPQTFVELSRLSPPTSAHSSPSSTIREVPEMMPVNSYSSMSSDDDSYNQRTPPFKPTISVTSVGPSEPQILIDEDEEDRKEKEGKEFLALPQDSPKTAEQKSIVRSSPEGSMAGSKSTDGERRIIRRKTRYSFGIFGGKIDESADKSKKYDEMWTQSFKSRGWNDVRKIMKANLSVINIGGPDRKKLAKQLQIMQWFEEGEIYYPIQPDPIHAQKFDDIFENVWKQLWQNIQSSYLEFLEDKTTTETSL